MKSLNPRDGGSTTIPRLSADGADGRKHLQSSLLEFFAAAALTGLIASQAEEPDRKWACEWSFAMGRTMAAEAMRQRRLIRKR